MSAFDAAEWLRERNDALLSLDEARIKAYMRKYGLPVLPNPEVFWRAVHKARTAITSFPAEEKQKSKAWLFAHGSAHWDDAP